MGGFMLSGAESKAGLYLDGNRPRRRRFTHVSAKDIERPGLDRPQGLASLRDPIEFRLEFDFEFGRCYPLGECRSR